MQEVKILLYHLYDQSMVYMALTSGLSLCDVMYVPCEAENAHWESTKCNPKTVVNMTVSDREDLIRESKKTGEEAFYNSHLNASENVLKADYISSLTKRYRELRSISLAHCSAPGAVENVTKAFERNIQVRKGADKLFHYQGEKINPLDPLMVCLMQYCHEYI